jgi:hypothetical protein
MNDIRNAPVFFRVLIKPSETNSKIQDILIFALNECNMNEIRNAPVFFSGSYQDDRDQQ